MRLLSILEVNETALDEAVFRNSNVSNIIVFIVFTLLIGGCTYLFINEGYYRDGSTWSYLIYLWFVFWLGIFVWVAWSRIRSCLLPSNWLVSSSASRTLIKYRSFLNHHYDKTDPVVIELSWRDIIWVRKTKETTLKAKGEAAISESFTYLDIKLHLSEEELLVIESGLSEERRRKPLRTEVGELQHELFRARKNKVEKHEIQEIKDRIRLAKENKKKHQKKSGVKHHDYPVRLVDKTILRIRWNGIKPNISKALTYFALRTSIETEIKLNSDSTDDSLRGKELDDMILDRISKGDTFDAITLVKKHYGYTTTEAKQFIDEFTDDGLK